MEEGDELDRILARLNRSLEAREHAVRRLRVAITHLEDAGKLGGLKPWLLRELRRIEDTHHNVTDALDRLAGEIIRHVPGGRP